MKLSIALISATAVLASSFAAASTESVTGAFESYDAKAKTISIVKANTGALVTYKYTDSADIENTDGRDIKLNRLEKGTDVTLRLEASK